jgi:hypothetical protein
VLTNDLVFADPGPPLYPEDTSPGPHPVLNIEAIHTIPPIVNTGSARSALAQQLQFRPLWHILEDAAAESRTPNMAMLVD